MGHKIPCFALGDGNGKALLLQGATHAREYITTLFLLKEIEYLKNFVISGTIYIIPLVNFDGVQAVLSFDTLPSLSQKFIESILGQTPIKLYKANARGVDINTNFDACWGGGKFNKKSPSPSGYIGEYAGSEPETQALIEVTKQKQPSITLSYHSKGEVIYYGFDGKSFGNYETLNLISKHTGYKPILTKNSCGGYKDFCLTKLNILGYTIEVGNSKLPHPLGEESLQKIFNQNKDLPLILLK